LSIATNQSFTTILPALLIFGGFQIITSYISLKNLTFRKVVTGSATMLIKDGKVLEKNLLKERFNIDELNSKLREKNVFRLADVEFAFLEEDGNISVMKKANRQPLTPYDFKVPVEYTGIGGLVIEEGQVRADILKKYGLTRAWLMSKLAEQGVLNISKVMIGQVDSSGTLYVDLYKEYEEELQENTSDQMTLAKLKKVESDFLIFASETRNESAQKLYKECGEKMEHVSNKFNSYIKEKEQRNTIINKKKLQ